MKVRVMWIAAGGTFILTTLIMATAFVLSYANLMALAEANGFGDLSWLWPAILDAGMIVANVSLLFFSVFGAAPHLEKPDHAAGWISYWFHRIVGGPNWYQWALVSTFTATSVWMNIMGAPDTFLGKVMHAWAPATVFVLTELIIRQLRFLADYYGITKEFHSVELIELKSYQEFYTLMISGNGNRPKSAAELQNMAKDLPRSTAFKWWSKWLKAKAQGQPEPATKAR